MNPGGPPTRYRPPFWVDRSAALDDVCDVVHGPRRSSNAVAADAGEGAICSPSRADSAANLPGCRGAVWRAGVTLLSAGAGRARSRAVAWVATGQRAT